MKLEFAKIHGAGNDFVFVEDLADRITLSEQQIAFLCDRHFGIGADGVILVKPSPQPGCDAYMNYYNSDGTVAQMCGNGVRCFAKFLVDRNLVDVSRGYVDVWTLAGAKHIEFELDGDEKLTMAKVDMGLPILAAEDIPTRLIPADDGRVVLKPFETPLGTLELTCVSMGNPHCVIFMDSDGFFKQPQSFDIASIGSWMECNDVFPEKCNIEFAYVAGIDDNGVADIFMRVWERGCGETLACGTGACATGVAAHLAGKTGRTSHVHLRGGTLVIEWCQGGRVCMTGPASEVYTGVIEV